MSIPDNIRKPLRNVWRSMCHRCTNPKNTTYNRYGGKGITVCVEWLNSFDSFAYWALANGWQQGLHIDKDIKSKKLGIYPPIYAPETCSIVTPRINSLNASCTKFSEDAIQEIVAYFDSSEDTFQHRKRVCEHFAISPIQLKGLLARRAGKRLGRGKSGVLTSDIKKQLIALRSQGKPFKDIATILGINYFTCKAWHAKYMRNNSYEL